MSLNNWVPQMLQTGICYAVSQLQTCPGNIRWIHLLDRHFKLEDDCPGLLESRLTTSLAVASEVEVLEDWLLNNKLLSNKGCNGNHSQTTVVELLGLKVVLGLGI